jgi:hypothetical protein
LFSSLFLDQSLTINIDIGTVASDTYLNVVQTLCGQIATAAASDVDFLSNTTGYDIYIGTVYDLAGTAANPDASTTPIADGDDYSVVIGFKDKSNPTCVI